jgi:hypothetical protein
MPSTLGLHAFKRSAFMPSNARPSCLQTLGLHALNARPSCLQTLGLHALNARGAGDRTSSTRKMHAPQSGDMLVPAGIYLALAPSCPQRSAFTHSTLGVHAFNARVSGIRKPRHAALPPFRLAHSLTRSALRRSTSQACRFRHRSQLIRLAAQFTSPRFTSPRFTSPRFTSPRFTSPRFTKSRQSRSRASRKPRAYSAVRNTSRKRTMSGSST